MSVKPVPGQQAPLGQVQVGEVQPGQTTSQWEWVGRAAVAGWTRLARRVEREKRKSLKWVENMVSEGGWKLQLNLLEFK